MAYNKLRKKAPNNILPIWQPVGFSTHIISKKVADKSDTKTSHTGTLDPMAEGVIVVLIGDERNKKYEYAKWIKGYEFEVVIGISTDTYDGLGLIQKVDFSNAQLNKKQVENVILSFKGPYTQVVPAYSAIKVKGKPLHWYARNNKLQGVRLPVRSGEIKHIELKKQYVLPLREIVDTTLNNIDKVTGDFRQYKVKKNWRTLDYLNFDEETHVMRIYVETTKGLYIRSLAQDICDNLNVIGFTYNLIRLKNGIFNKENCYTLKELFGKDYLERYDFTSHFT